MTNIFEQALTKVNSDFPSVYSKEDVAKIITDLRIAADKQEANRKEITGDDVCRMAEEIKRWVMEAASDTNFEDYVSLELNPYQNMIDVNFDNRRLLYEIEDALDQAIESAIEA